MSEMFTNLLCLNQCLTILLVCATYIANSTIIMKNLIVQVRVPWIVPHPTTYTAEMDSTFYEKFYMYMTKDTFTAMNRATPANFQFFVKVPETVTHDNRLDVNKGAMTLLNEFLEKISSLKYANKLGPVLIQLPPSFTVKEFQNTEEFLDGLPSGYDYAVEFRHSSWNTEGPWELETPKFLD